MRRLRVGLIGVGRFGQEHARNLATRVPDTELVAVCASHLDHARAVAEELDVPAYYDDPAALCADPAVEAVAICTNTASHVELLKLAMEHGKHVFCEKPLAETVEKCREAEAVVAAHPELFCMLGFMRRFDHSYVIARERIARGDIGDIVMVRCSSQDPASTIEGTLAYAPRSSGIFIDLAIHDIDLIRYLTGSEPARCWAIGGCYAYDVLRQYGDGDNVSAMLQMESGAMATIFAGRAAAQGSAVETEIIGTRGTLRIAAVPADSLLEIMGPGGVTRECYQDFIPRWHDAYVAEMEYFAACVLSGTRPEPGVPDGTRNTATAFALQESFRHGGLVEL